MKSIYQAIYGVSPTQDPMHMNTTFKTNTERQTALIDIKIFEAIRHEFVHGSSEGSLKYGRDLKKIKVPAENCYRQRLDPELQLNYEGEEHPPPREILNWHKFIKDTDTPEVSLRKFEKFLNSFHSYARYLVEVCQ